MELALFLGGGVAENSVAAGDEGDEGLRDGKGCGNLNLGCGGAGHC